MCVCVCVCGLKSSVIKQMISHLDRQTEKKN